MLSRQLARLALDQRSASLPPHVRHAVKLRILDTLGVALGALNLPECAMALGVAGGRGGPPEAMLLGVGRRVSALAAAWGNAIVAHRLTFDDVDELGIVHPACAIVPGALAVAEKVGASGRDLLAAIASGYQVAVALARMAGARHYSLGFHSSGTCLGPGVAAASASLLGLGEEATDRAIALALEQSAGLRQYQGDGGIPISAFHIGTASQAGVLAAELAAAGYPAPAHGLEGRFGFFKVMCPGGEVPELLPDVGDAVCSTSIKVYPSCRFTHGAIDAARAALAAAGGEGRSVRAVQISTFAQVVDEFSHKNCRTEAQSTVSTEYNVAIGLLYPVVLPDHFCEPYLSDPTVQELAAAVHLIKSDELSHSYPAAWPYEAEVVLSDGAVGAGRVEYPRGHPLNPVSAAEVEAKFLALAVPQLGRGAAAALMETVLCLEEQTARDVGEHLMRARMEAPA